MPIYIRRAVTRITFGLFLAVLSLVGPSLFVAHAQAAYYPQVAPSAWYVLPGQTLHFSGSRFAPNATVTASGAVNATISANSSGQFSGSAGFTVPYSWQNKKARFVFTSPGSAYAVPITISVGSFYPTLLPSTYYPAQSTNMSVSVNHFAPNEQVALYVGGSWVATKQADAQGAAQFTFVAPAVAGNYTLKAQGQLSGVATSRVVKVH